MLVIYATARAIRVLIVFCFFSFNVLRLLRGTAFIVTRVNLHVDFVRVNLSFVAPYYLKYLER